MSSIDLIILGMLTEKKQSAYELQKDIVKHQVSKWLKISVPSVYKKTIQLCEKGYLTKETVSGKKKAEKIRYKITPSGKDYFMELMHQNIKKEVSVLFDFNVVIANLNKVDYEEAIQLLEDLRVNFFNSQQYYQEKIKELSWLPLVGKTIIEQQLIVCESLLRWLEKFIQEYKQEQKKKSNES
ncbi:PadR family transcriptional regulator [Vagococcus entomophilus]|uniref:Transcription regulator PadR N-terminal domain-containing protein n=1 Tax=Vagococcus entomophilus TaxID=1160095 RepID=A0A430AID3_9ENTE|nr:PadR family transcriptional regulator [Vagococcus entomophilus]RSU07667.1 hypothetical protein CBF30_00035 [Vagococcus entomophilus]